MKLTSFYVPNTSIVQDVEALGEIKSHDYMMPRSKIRIDLRIKRTELQ